MKFNEIYTNRLGCTTETEVFDYLIDKLKPSNRTWGYFVNWKKVFSNVDDIEVSLNTLNYIIGKRDIEKSLFELLSKQPHLILAFPYLLASRDKKLIILHEYTMANFIFKEFDFSKTKDVLSEKEILSAIEFLKYSGFLKLLEDEKIKNLVDYVIGVEAGLDSNGRKNRSGHIMEDIVENFIHDICLRNGWRYLKEATANILLEKWEITLPVDKSRRRLDFVIDNGSSIYLIETNYYGGGGSKLKSTAKEYQKISQYWKDSGFKFLWITDGIGWNSSSLPLEEAFDSLDYILNLEMLTNNLLEDILKKNI